MRQSYRHLGRNGGLGNQLFQIAGTIGRAHRARDRNNAVFPPWKYAPYFSIPNHYFEGLDSDEPTVDGGRAYLQNIAEFAAVEEFIRSIFMPSDFALTELASLRPRSSEDQHITAVHVRRGDYLAHPMVIPTCPKHYFRRAMDEMRQRHHGTHFEVYSDDEQWCIDHLSGQQDVTIMTSISGTPIQRDMADFNAMRSANAYIISNSTYSWWPAFLNGTSDIICPATWMAAGAQVDIDDIVPETWLRLSIDPIGPIRTPLLLVSEGPHGYIVTDQRSHRVHHLNPASTLLFELCDGSNTLDDIASVMSAVIDGNAWRRGLEELTALGLVIVAPESN